MIFLRSSNLWLKIMQVDKFASENQFDKTDYNHWLTVDVPG